MMSPSTVVPLRHLTPEKATLIRKFYSTSSAGLFLALFLTVTLGLSLGGAFFSITLGLIIGVFFALLWVGLRYLNNRNLIRKANFVYEYGGEEELRFGGIRSNYGYKVNGAPQQIITVLLKDKPIEIKTFSSTTVSVYSLPQQSAYTHPQYPGMVLPSGLFSLVWPEPKKGAALWLRRALVFGLPFLFVFGLTWFINSEMNGNSETYGQPDALVYQQGGKLLMATVVTKFKAYEVSNKGVYGNDYTYGEEIDLATGKILWKTELNGKQSSGAARLLGQSDTYLFFLRGGLYVVDKATGKVVAQNNDFPLLQNKMPVEAIASYDDVAGYTWNDSLHAVVVKGTDGLYYTINGTTLHTATIDVEDADAFFKNRFHWGNNYEDQITEVWDDGTHCYALLDVQDTVLLAHNSYGVQERPAAQSVRRRLYRCSSQTLSDSWAALGDSVYLFGGFLVDATQRYEQPDDTISHYASYQSLTQRYNGSNAPLRTAKGSFLLMQKTTIEPSATLVLSAVSPVGVSQWQVRTAFGSIPFRYYDAEGNKLYLFGNGNGGMSDRLTKGLCIDVTTGNVRTFAIQ